MFAAAQLSLCVQVSEVTRHPVEWIRKNMSLARCYQAQIEFFSKHDFWSVKPNHARSGGADKVIR